MPGGRSNTLQVKRAKRSGGESELLAGGQSGKLPFQQFLAEWKEEGSCDGKQLPSESVV